LQGFIEYVTNFDLVKTYNLILLFWFIASVVATPAFRLLLYTLILNHALMTIVEVIFGSAVLFVVGIQGIAVTAIATILRQTESSTVLFMD
jgi:succinate-acetate transporter protein